MRYSKILAAALCLAGAGALAAAPNQGSPTYASLILQNPLAFGSGGTGANTANAAANNFLNALPTTLPTSKGVWWNNGGLICKS